MQGQRLWMALAAVAVVALVLAGGGWWWLGHSHKQMAAAKQPHLVGDMGETATALDTTLPDPGKICAASLTRALDFGAVPAGATLVSGEAKSEEPEGHYSCEAQGADGKYTLAIDASCPGSEAKTCFALDSIKREDGTVVYKRRPWPYEG